MAPAKSIQEICDTMEECINDAAKGNIDFINYLCEAALNLEPDAI